MFRKLYKEANDEIPVNEKLLDNILNNAEIKPAKKKAYYKAVYPMAAAIALVFGCTSAISQLTEKPKLETDIIIPLPVEETVTTVPTEVAAAGENTKISVPTSRPEKTASPVKSDKIMKPEEPVKSEEPVKFEAAAEQKSVAEEAVADAGIAVAFEVTTDEAAAVWAGTDEDSNSGASVAEFSRAVKSIDITESLVLPDGFTRLSSADGYWQFGKDEQTFEIYQGGAPAGEPTITFIAEGIEYTVSSCNMTEEEIKAIFINLL